MAPRWPWGHPCPHCSRHCSPHEIRGGREPAKAETGSPRAAGHAGKVKLRSRGNRRRRLGDRPRGARPAECGSPRVLRKRKENPNLFFSSFWVGSRVCWAASGPRPAAWPAASGGGDTAVPPPPLRRQPWGDGRSAVRGADPPSRAPRHRSHEEKLLRTRLALTLSADRSPYMRRPSSRCMWPPGHKPGAPRQRAAWSP